MSTVQVGFTRNTKHIPVTGGFVDLRVNDYADLEKQYPEKTHNLPVGFKANESQTKNVRALTAITVLTMEKIKNARK